jgi:hypothetical protein
MIGQIISHYKILEKPTAVGSAAEAWAWSSPREINNKELSCNKEIGEDLSILKNFKRTLSHGVKSRGYQA